MIPIFCFAFEAKSIQSTILDGGKLRDMVGGSELIDNLCRYEGDDLVEQVKDAAGLGDDFAVSRRAGAALLAFHPNRDALARFSRLWSLAVAQLMPGLEIVSAIEGGENATSAMDAATKSLLAERNRPRQLMPIAGPLVRRYPRTGRPAVNFDKAERDYVDAGTAARRKRMNDRRDNVAKKFSDASDIHWPIDFEDDAKPTERFPLSDDNRYVGLMHADANGLGQLVLSLKQEIGSNERAPWLFRAFSEAVADATQRAAREATDRRIIPHKDKRTDVAPARPIVLGGDDLTIILRADIALPFTATFLEAFEHETRRAFDDLKQREPELKRVLDGWPELTAGAGIAFIKANQPFYLAYRLTETLATLAKDEGKRRGISSLAFHRITTAAIDDYSAIRSRELIFGEANDRRLELSMQPYALKCGDHGLPVYADLVDLKALIAKSAFASGPLRRAIATLASDPAEGRRLYERWREVGLADDNAKGDIRNFERVLQKLGVANTATGQLFGDVRRDGDDHLWRTPVLDALHWLAVERGGIETKPEVLDAA